MSTTIEWTDETWNPVTGCDRISPGCDHCYAMTLAKRLKAMGQPKYQLDGDPRTSGPGFRLTTHEASLAEPLSWRTPRVVFVNSMSDLFHKDVPVGFIKDVWTTMAVSPRHRYQVLTKRPQRMARVLGDPCFDGDVEFRLRLAGSDQHVDWQDVEYPTGGARWLPNVWLGTSIESDEYSFRADHLRRTPAAVRFLSCEPLLGPLPSLELGGIGWVIVGGESGAGHRPIDPGWVRDIRDRCVDAQVPFFFKQWGGRTPKAGGRDLDGRTWDQMPVAA